MILILNALKIFLFFSTVTFSNYRLLSERFKLRQKKIKYRYGYIMFSVGKR